MKNEQDIKNFIYNDSWMMSVLEEAKKLCLPDWVIGAGFLRNKIWDYKFRNDVSVAGAGDIDLVYFDSQNVDEKADEELSSRMGKTLGLQWEIVNQAYTHLWQDRDIPYTSTEHAISQWSETATAVGVTLKDSGELRVVAPHGIKDLLEGVVRLTPHYMDKKQIVLERIYKKDWLVRWPELKVIL